MGRRTDKNGVSWEVDAQGNPVPGTGIRPSNMGVDPSRRFEAPKAEAEVTGANLRNQGQVISNQITNAEAPYAGQKARADADKARADADKARADLERARMDLEQGKDPESAVRAAKSILRIIDGDGGIETQFTKFQDGVNPFEYLPSKNMRTFDADASFLKPASKKLFRAKGEGSQSDAEGRDYNALIPNTWKTDATNRSLIDNLREEALSTLEEYGQPAPKAAEFGSTKTVDPINPDYQAEYERWVASSGGNFTPEQYAEMRSSLDKKFYPDAQDQRGEYLKEGEEKLKAFRDGGGLNLSIPPTERDMTGMEKFRNDLVSNPVGAGFAGFADSMALGGIQGLAGDQFNVLSESNPNSMMMGQIVGAIGGTGIIGKAGKETIGRAIPKLLEEGGKKQFGRNLATDATYSALYSGNRSGYDPDAMIEDTLMGTAGSAFGQAGGKALSSAIGGVKTSPAVQSLKDAGVRLTAGRTSGTIPSRFEDMAASLPVVGDMIRARNLDSFTDFNRAGFKKAGESIGFEPSRIGREGVEDFRTAVSGAYDDATSGANAVFDNQFLQDFGGAMQDAQRLPPDLRRGLGEILDARIAPLTDAGAMTGDQYQQAMRALKASRNKPPSKFEGFEQYYKDSVTKTMDALRGQMTRSAPEVGPKLDAADYANRAFKTIENATQRAKGGSQTGELYTYTPSHLQSAIAASQKKFPGEQPLIDLADAGQEVLPSSVPNTGTTDRAIFNGLGAAALGGAAASDSYLDTNLVNPYTLGAVGMATAGGTRAGQRAINGAITMRPEAIKRFGDYIRKRQGMFGAATLPYALQE